jgi:YesN/AraC family two-component response regulator
MLPVHGCISMVTSAGNKRISGTQICLLPIHHACTFCADGSNESLVIEIDEIYAVHYFKSRYTECEGDVLEMDTVLRSVKELLIREVLQHHRDESLLLLNYLLHKITERPVTPSILFIHEHYAEKIDIKALAAMEHYTPSYYCDWFKRKIGMTPLAYIHFLRIHRAKEMLHDSKMSVLDISYQVGYEYNASFTKMFKKYERKSPSEYRAALHLS